MSKRLVVGLLATVAVAAGVTAGMLAYPRWRSDPALADVAVASLFELRLNDADGKSYAFDAWRGKTLVVNFWATWCPPCREEMPAFSRVSEKFSARGVQFVGVALDSAANVGNFAKQWPVSYPLLIAESDGIELSRQLGNSRLALPYTLVIAANGKVALTQLGRVAEAELENLLHDIATH